MKKNVPYKVEDGKLKKLKVGERFPAKDSYIFDGESIMNVDKFMKKIKNATKN